MTKPRLCHRYRSSERRGGGASLLRLEVHLNYAEQKILVEENASDFLYAHGVMTEAGASHKSLLSALLGHEGTRFQG
jgi:hypothetical protein